MTALKDSFAQISLGVLHDLANAAGAFDLPQLLHLIVDTVIRLAGAQRGFLMLQEGDHLEFAVARNCTGGTVVGASQEVSYTIIADVARSRRAVLTTDAQVDYRQSESVRGIGVKSVVACPLISWSGALVGVIYLDDCRRGEAFDEDDLDMLTVFASQAATAIENARLQQALGQQGRQLAALNRLRQEFIEALEQELCTPLAEVRASLELLGTVEERARREDLLRTARDGLDRFLWVLNRLMEFSADEMASVFQPDEQEVVHLRPLVADCLGRYVKSAQEKHLLLINNVPEGLFLVGAARRLRRALLSVLDNAVEYTERGEVEVSAGSLQVEAGEELPAVLMHRGRNFVWIRVRDTGPGIPPDELPLVFERFFRGRRHSKHGLGLGLTAARRDIEAQGGAVLLQSWEGVGTVVSFYLPAANGQARPHVLVSSPRVKV